MQRIALLGLNGLNSFFGSLVLFNFFDLPKNLVWLSTIISFGLLTYWNRQSNKWRTVLLCFSGLMAVGVLFFLQAMVLFTHFESAMSDTTRTNIHRLEQSLNLYHLNIGSYPTTEQGLKALRTAPVIDPIPKNWNGPYLKGTIPQDGWNEQYVYLSDGQDYEIISYGADGEVGGDGARADISSKQQ